MQQIYGIVGIPGAGKTWVTSQLKDKFHLCHHDAHIGHASQPDSYVREILHALEHSVKPILIEMPFSMSAIMEPLAAKGYRVKPVFIIESPEVVSLRYLRREKKMIPKGHLTRMNTYAQRAKAGLGFAGTSQEVLDYLKEI